VTRWAAAICIMIVVLVVVIVYLLQSAFEQAR